MSYVALYRKFRPDNFYDVKGQDHIVTTLKNQIINDSLAIFHFTHSLFILLHTNPYRRKLLSYLDMDSNASRFFRQ